MNKVTNIYVKHFSKIGNVQQEKEVFYNLVESEEDKKKGFGLELVEMVEGLPYSDTMKNLSTCPTDVLEFLTLLFENAITVGTWRSYMDFFPGYRPESGEEKMMNYG